MQSPGRRRGGEKAGIEPPTQKKVRRSPSLEGGIITRKKWKVAVDRYKMSPV